MCAAGLLFAVIFLVEVWTTGASKEGCPDVVLNSQHFAKVHNGTCYLFVNQERFWDEARQSCWGMGGEMLSIQDYHTMHFIRSTLNSRQLSWNKKGVWLGAKYTEGRWRWTSGKAMAYANWAPGEPSKILGVFSVENCALMRRGDNWRWHDYICGRMKYHYNYICEFPVENTTPTTTTTISSTTVTTSVSGAGYVHKDDHVSEGLDVKLGNDWSYRRGNRRGQEVDSMVLDNDDADNGAPGYPHERHPAFPGYNEVHPASPSQNNGNLMILTIILSSGGIILLVLLLIFLIVRRRYNYKKYVGQPGVHFENRSYNHSHHQPLPPPPAPHSFHQPTAPVVPLSSLDRRLPQPPPPNHTSNNVPYAVLCDPHAANDLYLTPQQMEDVYEEVQASNTVVPNLPQNAVFGQGSLTRIPAQSDDMLGACGGASQLDLEDQSETPLISAGGGAALWGQSEESLHSMSGSLTQKTSSIHNDYVDMNGSPVVPARCAREVEPASKSENGKESDPKDSVHKSDGMEETDVPGEGKQHYGPNYSNLMTTSQERCENLYAQLR